MHLLEIQDLWVRVEGREVLQGINMNIPPGETHILFGKNGSGKTSLLMAIMGFSRYEIVQGRITYQGEDITHLPPYERARRGLGLAFQRPPTIRGLRTVDLLKAYASPGQDIQALATFYQFTPFLEREVNYGFSGGEIKRSELLQLLAQDPTLVLLDEPESGVDLENLQVVGEIIARLLHKDRRRQKREKSGLIITHTGFILEYVNADVGYIMLEGRLLCAGNPREILEDIKKFGYEECSKCRR